MADKTIRLEDHDEWLLSFVNGEKRAYRDVKLFLVAVGRLQNLGRGQVADTTRGMHKYFPIFAKKMGWTGPLYEPEPNTGRCPAVTLYLRDDVPGREYGYSMISPWRMDIKEPWRFDESPVKEKLLEAARVVCRQWLPNWDWSRP